MERAPADVVTAAGAGVLISDGAMLNEEFEICYILKLLQVVCVQTPAWSREQ